MFCTSLPNLLKTRTFVFETSTSVNSFVSNWQLSFLNQRKSKNGSRNGFMINLRESYIHVAELGFELSTLDLEFKWVSLALGWPTVIIVSYCYRVFFLRFLYPQKLKDFKIVINSFLYIHFLCKKCFAIWAGAHQFPQLSHTPSEDLYQPMHPHIPIRVLTIHSTGS